MSWDVQLLEERSSFVFALITAALVVVFRASPWWLVCGVAALIAIRGFFSGRTFPHAVSGKSVLVTGASSGIGRQLALQAARSGAARVVIVARNRDKLESV